MANFFSNLFGRNKSAAAGSKSHEELIHQAVDGIIDYGGFDLSFEIENTSEGIIVNFTGADAKLLTEKDGLVLDGFQTFLKRMLQNRFPQSDTNLIVDCDGFLENSANELRKLADKLKELVLEKGQVSYVRALPPRDRKTVHRHLALDPRVKAQSVGEGFCKKIRISPTDMKHERRSVPSHDETVLG